MRLFRGIALASLALMARPAAADDDDSASTKIGNPWAAVLEPALGSAESFGGYSAGCVRGARALPMHGRGFQLARPGRGKNYGHPLLIDFIKKLGAAVARKKLGVLFVADLGQPRGGPAPNGHSSHQSGLDVDIWYWHPRSAVRRVLPASRREKLTPPAMVSARTKRVNRYFSRRVRRKIELAARDRRVARIFVNPAIKKALCDRTPKRKRGWLRKLRPWWGHDRHFHVRLECPADSPGCEKQTPIAEGDGCEELDWWLDEKAQAERREQRKGYRERVRELPELPEACAALLSDLD